MKGPLKFLEEYFVSFEKPFSENWRGRLRWRPLIRMSVFGYNIMGDSIMQKYTYGRTYVCNIKYHIIWCVKYRKKVLSEEISKDLYGILKTTAKENGFSVLEVQVGEMDHVHCFVSAPPSLSISDIVRLLKGTSARILMQNYPNLHKFLWKGHLWNPSYFVETIGSSSEENIKKYIENQKN